jgi:hypothetical protein
MRPQDTSPSGSDLQRARDTQRASTGGVSVWRKVRGRIREWFHTPLTTPAEEALDDRPPILLVLHALGYATFLVLSLYPFAHGKTGGTVYLAAIGSGIFVSTYASLRSQAFVKPNALRGRRAYRFLRMGGLDIRWRDYEPRGRVWWVVGLIFGMATVIGWVAGASSFLLR